MKVADALALYVWDCPVVAIHECLTRPVPNDKIQLYPGRVLFPHEELDAHTSYFIRHQEPTEKEDILMNGATFDCIATKEIVGYPTTKSEPPELMTQPETAFRPGMDWEVTSAVGKLGGGHGILPGSI